MKIAVVIVNYRTPDLVVNCLASLAAEADARTELEVSVGDAASGDGSLGSLKRAVSDRGWQDWVRIDDLGQNGGFAFGNNAIVKRWILERSDIDFVHFLNPDTYIHPGAVRALATFLAAQKDAGAAGSQLENPDGTLRSYAFRFPTPWREFFRGARLGWLDRLVPRAPVSLAVPVGTQAVDWVSGASFMVPHSVLKTVGPMNDNFFLYFEETEFMARIRDAGLSVWHVPESRVVHLAGQSTGVRTVDGQPTAPSEHWFASRRLYFCLRYGQLGAALADVAFLSGDVFYRIHRLLRFRRPENPPHLWSKYLAAAMSRQ